MSNVLKVSHQEAIRSLHEKGWSQRRIARELGINGRTVRRYIQGESKCSTISTPGSSEESDSKCTSISTPGSESVVGREPTVSVADHLGRKSRCEPFEAAIDLKMKAGLSAQRIYQDLVEEKGFLGSYQSVKRFVRRLRQRQPERVWRIECQPGEEMQVDFGLGAPIEQDDGKMRRSWVLRAVLSYSRKGYSEAVMRQDTESFLRCLENALRHFGGVPLLLNLDNLKAAVLKADWFDPQINPKLAEFCRHYHIHVMPCRPRMPQHKGKVERGVSYVRGNALKGRRFKSLAQENAFLSQWEENVADKRIHGTRSFVGPPGVGKSHLRSSHRNRSDQGRFPDALPFSVRPGARAFPRATQAGESRPLGKYLKPDLLIIDDMGLKILPPKSGEILLEIIMRRYENRSTLMTSNRPIEEWGKLLSDVPAASAILDRLLHHAEVIAITGRNHYRNPLRKPSSKVVHFDSTLSDAL